MTTYSKDDIFKECLKYYDNFETLSKLCMDKYLLKNKQGEFLELSPDDMIKRFTKEFIKDESTDDNPLSYEEIYE